MSHRIRALENFVGATLFSRWHNGVTLTDEGIVLIESVGKALSLTESACTLKKDMPVRQA
jgi:DNA-binding transcriptional LysR family regulator